MNLTLLAGDFAICQLAPGDAGPPWWRIPGALSLRIEVPGETTVLCPAHLPPPEVRSDGPWRCFELQGPLPFEMVGVLHGILGVLAAEEISILAYSSFDTDYVLVPAGRVAQSRAALEMAGYGVVEQADR
jgi:hypothetical protein